MNALYTIAYPRLGDEDEAFIEQIRARHDAHSHFLLRAHFTLLFACDAVPEQEYLAHVAEIARKSRCIAFACRYAQTAPVAFSRKAHVFLVPDEGFAAISLLHDALYTGVMATHLRLEPPYVPHVTLASVDSPSEAQKIAASLNTGGLNVRGLIDELHVGSMADEKFVHHASYPLPS